MKAIVALIFLLVIAAPTWATPINVLIMEGEARNFVIGGTLSVVGITGDGRLLTGGGGSNDFFGSNSSFDCSTSGCPRGFPLDLGAIYLPEPAFGTAFMLEGVSNPFPLESARFVAEPARVPDTPGTVSVPFTFEGSAREFPLRTPAAGDQRLSLVGAGIASTVFAEHRFFLPETAPVLPDRLFQGPVTYEFLPIPEPGTLLLVGGGVATVGVVRWWRRQQSA
jgi:PEP-CTERM motif